MMAGTITGTSQETIDTINHIGTSMEIGTITIRKVGILNQENDKNTINNTERI
jgi:hypothetical protein